MGKVRRIVQDMDACQSELVEVAQTDIGHWMLRMVATWQQVLQAPIEHVGAEQRVDHGQ